MAGRFLMVLDFGTGAGRCSLVEVGGQKVFAAQQEWGFEAPPEAQPGGFSFVPERFWKILGGTAKAAMVRGDIKPSEIVAVSATSIREGFVLLDVNGHEIFAVPNRDARAFAESREVGERLCGERACEPTNASETSLFNIKTLVWDEHMMKACEIPAHIFPPIVHAGQVLGKVTPAAAAVTGLAPGTPVVVSGADTQCGVLGSGGLRSGDVVVVAGTSTPIQMVLDSAVIDPRARTWTGPYLFPGNWVLESNAGITGSVLRWFRDSFCEEEKTAAKEFGGDAYGLMEQLAQKSPIGSSGVTALMGPRIMNARLLMSPFKISGFMVALPRSMVAEVDSKRHFVRAILESFSFAVRGNCEQLEEISGKKIQRLTVCGGSSAGEFWMQMLADTLGIPVDRPGELEASSRGAAVCAGVGVREFVDFTQGVEVLVKRGNDFEPRPENKAVYDAAYQQWLGLQVR
jgi:sugar (pentulose or hexulose) kinase